MNNTTQSIYTGGATAAWPRSVAASVVFGGAGVYVLQGSELVGAKRFHQSSPMAATTIDGWPPGLSGDSS